jgi:CubicO group peptidase (beta-lactamase class C family)
MTAALVGMLVDEEKLAWDDPVQKHLPWFQLKDAAVTRELTVRDLLTHRGGLGNADFLWYGQSNTTRDILDRVRLLEPAYSLRSRFLYQNIMYAAVGEVIAAASGRSWAEMLRTRIFEPLGMTDTAFFVPDDKLARFATNYAVNEKNEITPVDVPATSVFRKAPAFPSGGGGLVSTADDYARFALMLAGDGRLGKARLLSRKTVELMRSDHLTPSEAETFGLRGYRVFAGNGFGLGVMTQTEISGYRGLGSLGKNGWGGAAGTWSWVDPEEDLVAVLMIQRMAFGSAPIAISRDFETAVYQAIAD